MSFESLKSEIEKRFPLKGKSSIAFPSDYTIVDLETTGLSPIDDDIIEFGAIKIRDNKVVSTFSELCKPEGFKYLPFGSRSEDYVMIDGKKAIYISPTITGITHITNKMLEFTRDEKDVLSDFLEFLGDDLLYGHNVSFDVDFLYASRTRHYGEPVTNDYSDTLRVSQKLLKQLGHHRLKDLADYYNIDYTKAHRAVEDCEITRLVLEKMKLDILDVYGSLEEFIINKKPTPLSSLDYKWDHKEIDRTNPFYDKAVVFTMFRNKEVQKEMMKRVLDDGGHIHPFITDQTDYLVYGNDVEETGNYLEADRHLDIKKIHLDLDK